MGIWRSALLAATITLIALPASAAAAARFTASPSVVPAAGGSVRLTARAEGHLRVCAFSSPLNGQVRSLLVFRNCGPKAATVLVNLPPNYATTPEPYSFELDAYPRMGDHPVLTKHVTVIESGRPAAVVDLEPTWSGYVATDQTFGIVSGVFTVPAVTCAAGATTVSSQWVGIDGWGGPTVEQDGVEMDCHAGAPQYYAWYEMYGDPAANGGYAVPLPPQQYPVSPGDVINAGVSAPTPNDPNDPHQYTWYLSLFDATRNWVFSATIPAPTPPPAQDTAEWIVERPDVPGVSLLSDFGTASFTSASAVSTSEVGGAISDFPHRSLNMQPASAVLATASPLTDTSSDSSFSVTWAAAG